MKCKNCEHPLNKSDNFCPNCGAKNVTQRTSLKSLISEFSSRVFAWDNRYFRTFKGLIVHPEKIFTSYIEGTRKKFTSPISFLAICAAFGALCFNIMADEYMVLMENQTHAFNEMLLESVTKDSNVAENLKAEQLETQKNSMLFTIKNYYLISFIGLPFYALLSFLVYFRPYNYGEHLVFNCYAQGLNIIMSVILMFASLIISPSFFSISFLIMMAYYIYAFSRLYKHGFLPILLRFLWFIFVFIVVAFVFLFICAVIGIAIAFINK
ncbi:MAG: DUF3667 domain-containing protein [Bacteroidota bacterium]